MLVRRRKVRIEVEQQTVRMKVSSSAPAVPVAESGSHSVVEPIERNLLNVAHSSESKMLKSGEAL